MIIKDFFQKDINRNIETVIKADDLSNSAVEVAEYVITNEIAKKIRDFFQAYNNYSNANGVWISGFFGSGKSHLLKILSYVLENKDFDGMKSGEVFAAKIEEDVMLQGDVLAATRIPSESILFNIDQQAQITSKANENAILSVFYKVFYDHLGFYGFQTHIAEFEMWLDSQNQYESFKTAFEERKGEAWVKARLKYFDPLVTDTIAEVLADFNQTDVSKYETILDEIEDRQKQSIEDFCQRVLDYINRKQKGFRLNFFVDEVGQYISDNTKLMLNLQTIAETLATKTRGASWILVTSQEDMETIVGDMNKSQQNDFSRIQARFKLKIPLTSANVDEVIEKRLLKKNETTQQHLATIFKNEKAHLDTLLSFSEAGVQFKGYRNEQDFANKLPFVSYQFDLFQQCRKALSVHNAFQGKHSSVGERSMLSVFQQVIRTIEEQSERSLVSFDLMFDGIRNELKGEIQNSLILAEKQLDNLFAIKVLKALFLVKYYGNFKTTKRNISVLMINQLDIDLKNHEKQLDEALNILELQSYVQRSGDIYEFLTDDEKDVEQEIKNTDIDEQKVTDFLREVFFDEIIKDAKIKYLDNKQDYEFTNKMDGFVGGREKELEIEIISENSPLFGNEDFVKSQSMGTSSMKMLLPSNAIFMKDVRLYLKTDKYIKQSQSSSNRDIVKRILQEKAQLNAERRRNLILIGNDVLSKAGVYINGAKIEITTTSDARTRVANAFQHLIKSVFPNLRMLGIIPFSEETIKNTIKSSQHELEGTTISEAETEVLTQINRRKKQADRTTLNDLRTIFSKRPYGWYPNAIWNNVAKLYKKGKLELKKEGNILENEELLAALFNTRVHDVVMLEPQVEFSPQVTARLKNLYKDAFDESSSANEAKEIAMAFQTKMKQLQQEIIVLQASKKEFPFLKSLDEVRTLVDRLSSKQYGYFLDNIKDFEDDLLDAKENWVDPIKRFVNSEQATIYGQIKILIEGNTANFEYLDNTELKTLQQLLAHPKPYTGSLIREAKEAKDTLTAKMREKIEDERTKVTKAIQEVIHDFQSKEEFNALDASKQLAILRPFEEKLNDMKSNRYIANMRDVRMSVLERLKPQQLNELMRLSTPVAVKINTGEPSAELPVAATIKEPALQYVSKASIKIGFSKTELCSENDVNEYIEVMRLAYLKQINEHKRISL